MSRLATDSEVDALVDGCCEYAESIEGWFVNQTIAKVDSAMKNDLMHTRAGLAAGVKAAGFVGLVDASGNVVTLE
jgi:hypothetical protein